MGFIYLQPAGEIEMGLLQYLSAGIQEIYGYPCRISLPIIIPGSMYNAKRGQYDASGIVGEIAEKTPADGERILGVVDVDLFVPDLNFVFGVAIGNAAVISLIRLRPEYYGEKENEILFRERALKEAVHELGHTFGISHCPDIRCVMHFSNSLEDTDIKGSDFCGKCSGLLGIRKL